MHFGNRNVLALTAQVVHFQNVEAHTGTDWTDDVAFLRRAQRLGKQGWQLLNTAPAHLAAFQRLLVSRVGDRQFAEVIAITRLLNDSARLTFRLSRLIGGWVFRQWDQDVAQVKFSAGIILITHLFRQGIHFLRQDGDAATDFIVTHF